MRARDELGIFWWPAKPENQHAGRFRYDPAAGIEVELVGTSIDGCPEGESGPRILGIIGDIEVTLMNCWLKASPPSIRGVKLRRYRADHMFVGHHYMDDICFTQLSLEARQLAYWIDRSGIETTYPDSDTASGTFCKVEYSPVPAEEVEFSGGTLRLLYRGNPDTGIGYSLTIDQVPVFEIIYREPRSFDEVQLDQGLLQALVTLCIDEPWIPDRISFRSPDVFERSIGGHSWAPYLREIEWAALLRPGGEAKTSAYQHPYQIFLTFDQLGGITEMARWLDIARKFPRVIDALMTFRYDPKLLVENRFLNVSAAAEAYVRRINLDDPVMPAEVFDGLLSKYLEATPEVRHRWLRNTMRHANTKSLSKKLSKLRKRTSTGLAQAIPSGGDWCGLIAAIRNDLTHLGVVESHGAGQDLYYLTDSVYMLVRQCMLLDCGVDPTVLLGRADSYPLTKHVKELRQAMMRWRARLDEAR